MSGDTFGKPIPCPKGARYFRGVPMPARPPPHRELSPEERAARRAAYARANAAAATLHVQLLADGMQAWADRARQKWLAAGGYGGPLTPEEEQQIRAAGFEPAPRDR